MERKRQGHKGKGEALRREEVGDEWFGPQEEREEWCHHQHERRKEEQGQAVVGECIAVVVDKDIVHIVVDNTAGVDVVGMEIDHIVDVVVAAAGNILVVVVVHSIVAVDDSHSLLEEEEGRI